MHMLRYSGTGMSTNNATVLWAADVPWQAAQGAFALVVIVVSSRLILVGFETPTKIKQKPPPERFLSVFCRVFTKSATPASNYRAKTKKHLQCEPSLRACLLA